MRTSSLAVALCAVLAAIFGASWAQDDAARAACAWDTAERLTVRGIDGAGAALRGRCVRVRAELDGWALRAPRPHRGLEPAQIDFIGAYAREEEMLAAFRERPRRAEVLGVVGHCRDICAESPERDEEGNVIICMARGFCHYYDDPYIMIEAVR